MAAPFTQDEIQTEIDACKSAMRKAMNVQTYSAESVSVSKANLDSIRTTLDYWIGLMGEYYPDAFDSSPTIEFNEIGFLSG